jgi:hypothetical protein
MKPAHILALGPELRLWAREFTHDLNEAYYLAHEVVRRLLDDAEMRERPVDLERARTLLRQVAEKAS